MTAAILILTLSDSSEVNRFAERYEKKFNVKFRIYQLSSADLNLPDQIHFGIGEKSVILLHPNEQGRGSITNVVDAKFDKLMQHLSTRKTHGGIKRIAVIVFHLYGFDPRENFSRLEHLENNKLRQRDAFVITDNNFILCDSLFDLHDEDKELLRVFITDAEKEEREIQIRRANERHMQNARNRDNGSRGPNRWFWHKLRRAESQSGRSSYQAINVPPLQDYNQKIRLVYIILAVVIVIAVITAIILATGN